MARGGALCEKVVVSHKIKVWSGVGFVRIGGYSHETKVWSGVGLCVKGCCLPRNKEDLTALHSKAYDWLCIQTRLYNFTVFCNLSSFSTFLKT